MRVWLDNQEVTERCTAIRLERQLGAAGAEASVSLVCTPESTALPRLDPACGQWVEVRDGEQSLFSGRAVRVSFDAEALTLTLDCLDPACLLAACDFRGPVTGTPAEITRTVCEACGLQAGTLWEGDGLTVTVPAACGRSAFSVIRGVYRREGVTDWEDGHLTVRKKGAQRRLIEGGTLLSLTSRNASEEAVTRVRVYRSGELAAEYADEALEQALGTRIRCEHLSPEFPDALTQAKAGVRGVLRQARLTVTGLSPVRCGDTVALDRPMLGVYGDYLVTEVTCRCSRGLITTELGVEGH